VYLLMPRASRKAFRTRIRAFSRQRAEQNAAGGLDGQQHDCSIPHLTGASRRAVLVIRNSFQRVIWITNTGMRRVNVDGLIHATCAVIGSMRAQRYGRIVNVASIAGIGRALSGNAFYAATRYWPVFGPAGPF
jgi:short chain dehydrogenase